MELSSGEKKKHQIIYEFLAKEIKEGRFSPERKLPSERTLSEKFAVNLATVRRAFKELVITGVVEKRVGDGTYVVERGNPSGDNLPKVNIFMSSYDGPMHREFLQALFLEARALRFSPQIVETSMREALQRLKTLNPSDPLLLLAEEPFLSGLMRKMLCDVFRKVAIIGGRLDASGVVSVIGDDNHGIRLLVERLRKSGHSRIALVCNGSSHPVEKCQVAIWQALLGEDHVDDLLIKASVPTAGQPMDYAYKAVSAHIKDSDFTALICLNDELAIGAMAACRDSGRSVPGGISVVSIGNTALCRYSWPRLTCVDPNLSGHVRTGITALLRQDASSGEACLKIIKPTIVERDSIAAASKKP